MEPAPAATHDRQRPGASSPIGVALGLDRSRLTGELVEAAMAGATDLGRDARMMNRLAIAMGGGVRVGLEDNIWFDDDRTELATNPRLVERLTRIARAMGREPATPDQVRQKLGIAAPATRSA